MLMFYCSVWDVNDSYPQGNGPSSMSNDEQPILKPVARVPNTGGARNATPHIVEADDSDNDDDTPPSPSCSTQPTKSPLVCSYEAFLYTA